jgi:hypothetical protein
LFPSPPSILQSFFSFLPFTQAAELCLR